MNPHITLGHLHPPMRGLVRFGIVAAAVLAPSCSIFAPGVPSNDPILDCFVAVRNPDAEAEFGTAVPEEELFNRAEPFLGADGTPMRLYVEGIQCPPHFASLEAAEADWSRFARQRISQLGEAEDAENIFGRYPGEWCQVPGTLRCEDSGEQVDFCEDDELSELPDVPLPLCPDPPPDPDPPPEPDPCLKIACAGAEPCTSIDFGDVPLGGIASEMVVLTNCGEGDAPVVEVSVDGTVDPIIGDPDDFQIPPEPDDPDGDPANTCHPAFGNGEVVELGPGDACSFQVEFAPLAAGERRAETTFPSSTQPERHRIEFFGVGLSGSLTFEVVDLGTLPTLPLCFDAPASPCTPPRTLRATNAGPGAVTISSVRVESENPAVPTGIEVDPTVDATDPVVLGSGESLDLEVRWCDSPGAAAQAFLIVDSNDPDEPTFILQAGRLASCPDGS